MAVLVHIAATALGALLLYFGAEWLVKGAAGLARAFHIRPLVIGLTVVAYGTSAPELSVGLAGALEGRGALVLGNSMGSNIANVGLILGLTALIAPPRVDGALIRREVPALLASALVLPLVLRDGRIGRIEGLALLAGAVAFTAWILRATPGHSVETAEGAERGAEARGAPEGGGRAALVAVAAVGLALLVGGGKLLVDGAVGVARAFGVGERIVGLTVVAIGTSVPELAASLVAARRGHPDIAVGNVVGSNIFNVLLILGGAATLRPLEGAPAGGGRDAAAMILMTVLCAVVLRTERTIRRWEGALLVTGYGAFLALLVIGR